MGILEDLKAKGATSDEINIVGQSLIKQLKDKGASPEDIATFSKSMNMTSPQKIPSDIFGQPLQKSTGPLVDISKKIAENPIAKAGTGLETELGKRGRGLLKGATLGTVDLPGEETPGSVLAGEMIPYSLVGAGVSMASQIPTIAQIAAKAPRLARILQTGLATGLVGGARPAKDLQARGKNALTEAIVGAAMQGIGEGVGMAAEKIRKVAPKVANALGVLPEEDAIKVVEKPLKYTQKPMNSAQELNTITPIKDEVVKNIDDVFNFKVKNLEDAVVESSGPFKDSNVNSTAIKQSVSTYVNDMIDRGVIDKPPAGIDRLYARIDRMANKGYRGVTGTFGNTIKFADAHELKQDLYKIVGDSYGKGNFDDVLAGAYKTAAKSINGELRVISTPYAEANDALKVLYDTYDEIGKGGVSKLDALGGSKKFRNLFNDPEGRQILQQIENILPENKRFMGKLLDIEDTQRIRKLLQEATVKSPLGGMIGGGVGAVAGSPFGWMGMGGGGAAGSFLGSTLNTPKGFSRIAPLISNLPGTTKNMPIPGILASLVNIGRDNLKGSK